MGGRENRGGKAGKQGHAAIEAHALHRDLALIMGHRQDGIEGAVLGAQKHRIGREPSVRGDPVASSGGDRGLDHVDFLASEIAAVACGLSAITAIRGSAKPARRMRASVSFSARWIRSTESRDDTPSVGCAR